MGILNPTPDSFYDGGRWFLQEKAVERGIAIWKEGADWIDVGGESTRPNANAVSQEEELRRTIPVIRLLKKEISIPISIDTMKAKVAEAAVEAGASLINDVSGFQDPEMRKVAAQSKLPICLMHMQGTPQTMQDHPSYPNGVIPFLLEWFQRKIESLLDCGIGAEQIILDPGIGFGKTVAHNVEIIKNIPKIKALGFPVLVGLSRKSFLGKIVHKSQPDLLAATLAANTLAIQNGIDMIRVHDVKEHKDIIDLLDFLQ